MAEVKPDPTADGVALDGAYLRGQAKEAFDTFFAPVVGAFKGFSRHTRPVPSGGHDRVVAPDITPPRAD